MYPFEPVLEQYSEILAHDLKGVAEDLRTIELSDVVSYIRLGSYATLEDLLQSSTELFFQQGTLTFAWTAGVDLGWGELPTVTLGMEFRHGTVAVFFDLSLRAFDQSVEVFGIVFEDPVSDPQHKIASLREAIAQARLPERSACRPKARPGRRTQDGH